jgi:hypothetical protein
MQGVHLAAGETIEETVMRSSGKQAIFSSTPLNPVNSTTTRHSSSADKIAD